MSQVPAVPVVEPGQEPQQPPAEPQQPAGGPPEGGEPDPSTSGKTYSQAELDEVIGTRQAAKERARKAEEQFAEAQKQLSIAPPAEELEAFRAYKDDKDAQARDAAIKKGDVDAIENGVREPLEGKIVALESKLQSRDAQLSTLLKNNALLKAATELGAFNPSQIVALLRDRVVMNEQADGTFAADFRDAEGQPQYDGSAKRVEDATTFVTMFQADPNNANLFTAKARPGSGVKPQGGATQPADGNLPKTLADFNALPEDERQAIASKMTPEQRNAVMGIKAPSTEGYL